MGTLVRTISGLGLVVGVFIVGAGNLAGCGGASSSGVTQERDLGPFIITTPPAGDVDMAMQQQPQPTVDMAMKQQPEVDMAMPTGGCGTIDTNGVCQGNKLVYCNTSDTLVTKDCTSSGKVCDVSGSGYASCVN